MEQVKTIVGSLVRHGVTAAGATFVTNGYMTGSDVEVVAGAAAVIVSVLLSFIEKKLRKPTAA